MRRIRSLIPALPFVALFLLARAAPSALIATAPFTDVTIQAAQAAWGKGLGDLDGDGYLDIAEGGGGLGNSIYWYQYPGWQKFTIGTDGGGDDLQIADINHDGALDVVVDGVGKIVWYENPRGKGGNVQGLWTQHIIDATTPSHDIVIADLNGDGRLDVVIRVELGHTYYYLQGATPDIWTKVLIPQAPDGHGGLAVGDINRDGRPDLVENGFWLEAPPDPVAGTWFRHDVVAWTTGSSAAVCDINHDGRLDIFLAVSETGNTGPLSWFEAPVDPINGTWIRHDIDTVQDVHRFYLIDVNKDGTEDLVFAEMHQSAAKRVGVYYNNGLGSSWTPQVLSTQGSHNIAVGDIGNDGDIDIVGANWSTSAPDGGALTMWRNDENNATALDTWGYVQVDGTKTDTAFGLTFGDLDGDGRRDIISGAFWDRNPGGNMTAPWTRNTFGSGYDAMVTLDVNGDGQLDVIAQSQIGANIGIYWLQPLNSAATAWNSILVGTIPASRDGNSQGSAVALLKPGGRPQVIFSSDSGDYYFTIPANPFAGNWPRVQINTTGTQEDLAAADINGDGNIDIAGSSHVAPTAQGTEVDWWQNPGTGADNWTKVVVGTTAFESDRIRVADVNADGRPDIVVTDSDYDGAQGNLSWFEQQAGGVWVKHTVATGVGSLASMDVGDFNKDGKIDIVTGEHQNDHTPLATTVYQSVGAGLSWVPHLVDSGKESHQGTLAVDLDRDGDLDIVSIAYNTHQFVHLWRNDTTAMPADTTPPVLGGVGATTVMFGSATITWTTNEPADGQVEYGLDASYGSFTALNPAPALAHAIVIGGLSPLTTYHFRVTSRDTSGNAAQSGDGSFTTPAVDLTPPTIGITSPAGGAMVSGTISVTVNANDNVGVAGVQYTLDGAALGAEVTASPFSFSWNTVPVTNGDHTMAATARDAAGNTTTSSPVAFQVFNAAGFLQSAGLSADNSATTISQPFNSAVTAGDLIVAAASWGTSSTMVCSDTQANIYTTVTVQYDSTNHQALGICYASSVKAGATTVTATFGSSSLFRRLLVHEYSGIAASAPVDVTAATIANGTTALNNVTTTAATTAFEWDLVFAAVMDDAGINTIQPGTNYTLRAALNGSDLATEDRILLASGSVAGTWTFGSAHRYLARMVAFKIATQPPDVTPPVISAVSAGSLTSSGATIAWTTNEIATSQVMYGLDTTYGQSTAVNPSLVKPHSQALTGLAPVTLYHYKVLSSDATGNSSASADFTFTTPVFDGTPPVISAVNVTAIGTSTATINWTTDELADGQVNYGLTAAYGTSTALNATKVTAHSQALTGLQQNTLYHYQVLSKDAAGNSAASADFTFTTAPDVTPPVISAVTATAITTTGATITWTTNEASTSQVLYGADTTYGQVTTSNPALVLSHTQALTGLTPGTLYHFRATSTDGAGNPAASADGTFTTTALDVTPPVISGVGATAITTSSATIVWTTNEAADTQVNYGLTAAYGTSTALNATKVTAHSQALAGLQQNTLYHYQVLSKDASGNAAASADFTFTTAPDVTPPVISAVTVTAITTTSATVSWTTGEASSSQVAYGLDTNYGQTTTLNGALVLSHTQGLSGLAPATLYHFKVTSADAVGNPASSPDGTFTTATPDVTPPVISEVSVTSITALTATANWTTSEVSDTQVNYGLTSAYGLSTVPNAAAVITHAQSLAGLVPNSTYHYQVVSRDPSGNRAASPDAQFTTLPAEPNVPVAGLVSRWKFNEGSGTVAADSAGANPATLSNFGCTTGLDCDPASGWTGAGRFARAINLDGANDIVNAGHAEPLNDLASFSYAAWIFPRSLGGNSAGRIVDKDANGFKRLRLDNVTASSLYGEVRLSTTNAVATSPANAVSLFQWQHVVMTYDGPTRTLLIYTNGVLVGSGTGTGTPVSEATGDLVIGNNAGTPNTFDGLIDDVLLYNRALTPAEIQQLAAATEDLVPPVISGISVSGLTLTSASINWTTDEAADSQVEYGLLPAYGSSTTLNTTLGATHTVVVSGLLPATPYHFRVDSRDSWGHLTRSVDGIFTTLAPDTSPPTVSITNPTGGAVSGVITLTATASDDVGVLGVQYYLDGALLGSEATPAAFSMGWATTTAANGAHVLTAIARDAAGNTGTSAPVSVLVANANPVAFRQSAGATNDGAGTTLAQALTTATNAGNLIVAAVSWGSSSTLACSDTQGNVYSVLPVQYDATNQQSLGVCYAASIKGGAVTVTATFGVSSTYRRMIVHEYSGIATTNPLDVTAANNANGATAANNITTSAVTTTVAGDLIFAAVMDDAGVTTVQAGTSYTLRGSVSGVDLASEDRVQAVAGSVAGTFTFGAAHRYLARIVAFKAAGG